MSSTIKALLWFCALVALFGVIATFELRHFGGTLASSELPSAALYPVTLDGVQLYVRLASTPAEQEQGLSGTASLPPDQGLLFVFPRDGVYAFWMKDMNYSLDILWLADNGTIVFIARDLSPSSYPETYQPAKAARYVLEVNAGFAAEHGVKVGDTVRFQ